MTADLSTARGRPRWSILLTGAMACVLVYLVLVWVSAAPDGNIHTGDSDNLVAGTRVAMRCLDHGTLTSCGLHAGTRNSAVGPYPLLQYLPATALVELGLSTDDVLRDLAYLNILAFAGAIVLCLVAFNRRERRACRAIAIVAVLASSATYQSDAAFGEMLAAAITLAAVVAVIKRRTALIVVAAALAVLSKETFAPFVFALGLLAGRDEHDRWLPPKAVLVPLSVGVGLGTLATFGFNVFRFGTVTNTFYFDPTFQTPGTTLPMKFFAGIWLSPAAGLAWYWPVATIVVAAVGVVAVRRFVAHPREPLTWLPSLVLVLVAIGFTAGLALWFAPFGWIAYGPRLAVPLMPAVVVTALYLHGPAVERIAGRITRRADRRDRGDDRGADHGLATVRRGVVLPAGDPAAHRGRRHVSHVRRLFDRAGRRPVLRVREPSHVEAHGAALRHRGDRRQRHGLVGAWPPGAGDRPARPRRPSARTGPGRDTTAHGGSRRRGRRDGPGPGARPDRRPERAARHTGRRRRTGSFSADRSTPGRPGPMN